MSTFNSAEYAFCNISVIVLGKKIGGLRGIKYKTAMEKEVVYGAGNEPRGMQHGNKSYDGELALLQSEIEAMTLAAGAGKSIVDMTGVDIVVVYMPKGGGVLVTDIIKHAEFTEVEKGMNQNDKFAEISLPFIALGIEKGV